LYEVIETISGIHLILEYAHGGELFARLTSEKGPYKESEAKIVFAQIGSAIQYMVNFA
jgi:serine/threonine-protein kinase NIM1